MRASDRVVAQGLQYQGIGEKLPYSFATTPWGSSPTSITVAVLDKTTNYEDVTETVMPDYTGPLTPSGDTITLPKLESLTVEHLYQIEVSFTAEGADWVVIIPVKGKR
jgi:hypothetical protein